MEMINVLKRLAELDAGNPNVSQPTMKQEETLAVIAESPETITEGATLLPKLPEPGLDDMRALSGVKRLNESAIAECGMPAMGAPMPSLPASINMSAQSATEIVAMMRGMMDLAHSDRATQASMPAMGAPMPSLTPPMGGMEEPADSIAGLDRDADGDHDMGDHSMEPTDDTGSDELADMMKKLSTGEPVKIKTDMPVKVSTDKEVKSTDDAMNQKEEGYANSPDEKTKGYNPNDFANIINKVKTADIETTPYGSGSNPMPEEEEEDEEKMAESLENKLMAEYKAFMAEGEGEDKLLAAKIRKMLPSYHKRMEPEDAYQEVAEYLGISLERLYDVLEVNEGVDPIRKKYDKYDESAKPDFLDLDKDGNKKEPMKKAAKDVKKK